MEIHLNCDDATHLLLVAHGSLAADHDLAAGLLLQLLGRHATRSQNAADKVELKWKLNGKWRYKLDESRN